MTNLIVALINFYQQKLSPHKGFECAHRTLHGGDSCSEFSKKQIANKGFWASLKPIKQRFHACSDAARVMQKRPPIGQRGDCDLGVGACVAGSCDGGGVANVIECAACNWPFRSIRALIITLVFVSIIALGLSYYYVGRQIESVDIRLKPTTNESQDNDAIAKLFRKQQPDYQIRFNLFSGKTQTNTLKNTSAKTWITLKTKTPFYLSDIKSMTILNKGVAKSEVLDSITAPQKTGQGKMFDYRIKQKWGFIP